MNNIYESPSAQLKEVETPKKPGNPIIATILGLMCFIALSSILAAAFAFAVFQISGYANYDLANQTLGTTVRMIGYTSAAFVGCCISAVWSRKRLMPIATGACIIVFWIALSLYVQGYISGTNYLAYSLIALSSVTCVFIYRNKFKEDQEKASD